MKIRALLLIMLCLLGSVPTQPALASASSGSETKVWLDLAQQAVRAEKSRQWEKCAALWIQALEEAKHLGENHPFYSVSLRNVAHKHGVPFMKSTYNPKKAKECLEKELSILEALGPNYSDLKYDLMYLGLYDSMDGKFVQSLAKFERWLANFERNPAPSRVSAEAFIFMLVPVVELKLKSRQEDITERLVKIARRTAKTPREVAEVLDGWCYIVEERAPDSVKKGPFYQVATLLRKRALDEISNDYSQEGLALRSRILLNRGDNFVHDHQNDKATPCYLECLNFLERIKPDKSIKGTALTRLGFCVYRLDRKAEGLRLEAQGIKLLNEAAPQKWYAGRLKEIAREIADLKADTAAQNPTDLIQSHERLP